MTENDPDPNSIWVRAIRATKLSGLKDALQPGLPLWARGLWVVLFVGALSYGVGVGVQFTRDYYTRPMWLWVVLFVGALSYGLGVGVRVATDYYRQPILHTFHDGGVPIDKTPFPAMTVSSPYMFRDQTLKKAENIFDEFDFDDEAGHPTVDGTEWNKLEASKLFLTLEHICESSTSYNKQFGRKNDRKAWHSREYMEWISGQNVKLVDYVKDKTFSEKVFPFIKKGLTNCSEIITACRWRGSQNMACNELFNTVQTDVGVGCSFNQIPDDILRRDEGLKTILYERGSGVKDETELWTAWNIDTHPFLDDDVPVKNIPFTQKVAGKNKGFSFTLHYEEKSADIACPIFDSIGKMVTFHSPIEEPSVLTQGIIIPPGREVFIKLYPEVTIADPKIRNIDIAVRKCYFQDESPLTIYEKYTQGNCLKECVAQRINEACNCYPLSMTAGKNETICGPLEQKCVHQEIEKIDAMGYRQACRNPRCYQPCTDLTYRAEMTSAELITDNPSSESRISIVHAYINSESIVSHERTHHRDYNEVFGIIGGAVGLTNGIDILQIFRILHALLILACAPYKSFKRLLAKFRRYLGSKLQSKKKPETVLPVQQEETPAPSASTDARVEFIRVRPRQEVDSDSDGETDLAPEPEPSSSRGGNRIDYVDLYLGKLM